MSVHNTNQNTVLLKTYLSTLRKKVDWISTFFFSPSSRSLWDLGFLDQGLNPGPQQWKHGVLTAGPPWNSLDIIFENKCLEVKTKMCSLCFSRIILILF